VVGVTIHTTGVTATVIGMEEMIMEIGMVVLEEAEVEIL
jgi:hypothetical protein